VNNYAVNDARRRAFLLQLDLHEKMVPISDNNLIYCHRAYGPLFGDTNCDFGIEDECDMKEKSDCNFPNMYNKEGPNKYPRNDESFRVFSGSSTRYVKYEDYEVFQVHYK